MGGERKVDIWNVYQGQGRQDGLGSMRGEGNVVWVGDFNAWSKRWGGEESRRNREDMMMENWLDEWGLRVANEVGVETRYDEKSEKGRVLDIAVYGGGLRVRCKVGEGVVGMDHKLGEVEVEMDG